MSGQSCEYGIFFTLYVPPCCGSLFTGSPALASAVLPAGTGSSALTIACVHSSASKRVMASKRSSSLSSMSGSKSCPVSSASFANTGAALAYGFISSTARLSLKSSITRLVPAIIQFLNLLLSSYNGVMFIIYPLSALICDAYNLIVCQNTKNHKLYSVLCTIIEKSAR